MAGAPETGSLEDLLGSSALTLPSIVIDTPAPSAPSSAESAASPPEAPTGDSESLENFLAASSSTLPPIVIDGKGGSTKSSGFGFSFFGYDDNGSATGVSISSTLSLGRKLLGSVNEQRLALDKRLMPLTKLTSNITVGILGEDDVLTLPPKSTFTGDPKELAKAKKAAMVKETRQKVKKSDEDGSESEEEVDEDENEDEDDAAEEEVHFDPVELESDLEEEIEGKEEPQLKYKRMEGAGAVPTFLLQHPRPSCIVCHRDFLIMGCTDGTIAHMHPLSGAILKFYNPNPHPVNYVSTEISGNAVASCYSDGNIIVSAGEPPNISTMNFDAHKPVSFVALHPKFSSRKFGQDTKKICFATANSVVLREIRTVMGMQRTVDKVLSESPDNVLALKWKGKYIAYATTNKVVVFNTQTNLATFKQVFPSPCTICCLSWETNSALIVNYDRTVMKIKLDKKGHHEASMCFTTNVAQAIAPFGNFFITIRAIDNDNPYPLLCVINRRGEELSADALPVSAVDTLKADYVLFDFILIPTPTFYVVTPNEILIAGKCDNDDHIDYLLRAHRFYEALRDIDVNENQVTKWKLSDVGDLYMSKLIESNKLKRAASMCPLILRQDKAAWEKWTQRFEELGALQDLARYIPTENPVLDSIYYELVLTSLVSNSEFPTFLSAIKKWPHTVYNIPTIMEVINKGLEATPNSKVLLQALAEIYSKTNEHDKALLVFLKAGQGPIFRHIKKYKLFKSVETQIAALLSINPEKALRMLIKHADKINPHQVVTQLNNEEFRPHLLKYMHKLFVRYGSTYDLGPEMSKLQVEMYAQYISENYPPQEALPPPPTDTVASENSSPELPDSPPVEGEHVEKPESTTLTSASAVTPETNLKKSDNLMDSFASILSGASSTAVSAATSMLSTDSSTQETTVISTEDILSATGTSSSISEALTPMEPPQPVTNGGAEAEKGPHLTPEKTSEPAIIPTDSAPEKSTDTQEKATIPADRNGTVETSETVSLPAEQSSATADSSTNSSPAAGVPAAPTPLEAVTTTEAPDKTSTAVIITTDTAALTTAAPTSTVLSTTPDEATATAADPATAAATSTSTATPASTDAAVSATTTTATSTTSPVTINVDDTSQVPTPKKEYGRHSLIRFLRASNSYPADACAEVCCHYKLHKEQAFIYTKSGAINKALHIYMTELSDITHALRFVKEQKDPQLWDDLIKHAIMAPPEYNYINILLKNMGGAHVNPRKLLMNLPQDMIPKGIQSSLIQLLTEHSTEEFVRVSGNALLKSDNVKLFRKLFTSLIRGFRMNMKVKCLGCSAEVMQPRTTENCIFFYCGHAAHLKCMQQVAAQAAAKAQEEQAAEPTAPAKPAEGANKPEPRNRFAPLIAGTKRRLNCPLCFTRQTDVEEKAPETAAAANS
ncbi:vacuolar protein sorting-associated protein 41 [Pelomyxa schiedti]|nr:vacuolar protein sorting-associated protein 41 [Pelomyxa schiedti]